VCVIKYLLNAALNSFFLFIRLLRLCVRTLEAFDASIVSTLLKT
jgi:hypothetical protein